MIYPDFLQHRLTVQHAVPWHVTEMFEGPPPNTPSIMARSIANHITADFPIKEVRREPDGSKVYQLELYAFSYRGLHEALRPMRRRLEQLELFKEEAIRRRPELALLWASTSYNEVASYAPSPSPPET